MASGETYMKRMSNWRTLVLLATACGGATTQTQAAFNIEFDYSYDNGGFFNAQRKTLLESVATLYEARIADTLGAITPGGGNTWTIQFYNPNDGTLASVVDPTISADTLKIYVGARAMGGGTLGVGGYGGVASGSGNGGFISAVSTRGQSGSTGNSSTATDFAPWGGSISFNSGASWYFDTDPSTTESFVGQNDFYSVALHELGHVLGIGTAPSWDHLVNGSHQFTGANATTVYGGNVPLETDDGHFQDGLTSHLLGPGAVQETAMDPTITTGTRKYITELDLAALKDIGWEIATIPEPNSVALMGLGSLGFYLLIHRRKRNA